MILLKELAPKPNVFCAWCRSEGKETPIGYQPGLKQGETSEGICREHELELRRKHGLKIEAGELNVMQGTRPDPGWTNPMGGGRDTNVDKNEHTAWFETLGHAKDAIRELETHLDALEKVQDTAGTDSTDLQIGEIFDVLKNCHDELARLTGTGTVIPKSQPQNWPPAGQ